MFSIAICDDDIRVCSEVESIVMKHGKKLALVVKTEVFYSAESLFKELNNGYEIDIIYLNFNELDGLEIGRRIREEFHKEAVQIVYLASSMKYAMEVFSIRPLDFLLKPLKVQDIKRTFDRTMELSECYGNTFSFKSEGVQRKIQISSILYFKRTARTIELVTLDESWKIYDSLKELQEKLQAYNFFICHQS